MATGLYFKKTQRYRPFKKFVSYFKYKINTVVTKVIL